MVLLSTAVSSSMLSANDPTPRMTDRASLCSNVRHRAERDCRAPSSLLRVQAKLTLDRFQTTLQAKLTGRDSKRHWRGQGLGRPPAILAKPALVKTFALFLSVRAFLFYCSQVGCARGR